MRIIHAEPLAAEEFAPFGHVFAAPGPGRRIYLDAAVENGRPGRAAASLSVAQMAASSERPLPLSVIERHEFSSQIFTPLDSGRYLVVAAPRLADGGADLAGLRAFVGRDRQSFAYRANVWHGPIASLDGPMHFAIMMFRDGGPDDEEILRHDAPFAALVLD